MDTCYGSRYLHHYPLTCCVKTPSISGPIAMPV